MRSLLNSDEWLLAEYGFAPDRANVQEALLAVGNGYQSVRASLEEGHDGELSGTYLAGVYDRPCSGCRGHAGRVQVIDREAADPETIAAYDLHQKEESDYRALCAAERRMGA